MEYTVLYKIGMQFFKYKHCRLLMPDKLYLRLAYYKNFGQKLNLRSPRTYTEKLQWLKLYYREPLLIKLVDKYEVKKYVKNIIGKDFIIPTLGIFSTFDEINFEQLPLKFVIKCTHDSGSYIICDDKTVFDKTKAKIAINKALHSNYYIQSREWPYKKVPPRIIVEEYIESFSGDLPDYKFFCFNGEPKLLYVATNRNSQEQVAFDFFDIDFNHLPIKNSHPNAEITPAKPVKYDKMIEIARKLSAGLPHVRIDLYVAGDRIYFGEMTFFHYAGMHPFYPSEYDDIIGNMLQLPNRRQ